MNLGDLHLESGTLIAVVFWLFIAAVSITPIIATYKIRKASMDTIRAAIEKGQQLSPDMINQLSHMGEGKDQKIVSIHLKIAGAIVMASGVGAAAVATAFLFVVPVAAPYVYAGAALVFCIGAGLYAAAKILKQHEQEQQPSNPVA